MYKLINLDTNEVMRESDNKLFIKQKFMICFGLFAMRLEKDGEEISNPIVYLEVTTKELNFIQQADLLPHLYGADKKYAVN